MGVATVWPGLLRVGSQFNYDGSVRSEERKGSEVLTACRGSSRPSGRGEAVSLC